MSQDFIKYGPAADFFGKLFYPNWDKYSAEKRAKILDNPLYKDKGLFGLGLANFDMNEAELTEMMYVIPPLTALAVFWISQNPQVIHGFGNVLTGVGDMVKGVGEVIPG
jgi:hypothetical protein